MTQNNATILIPGGFKPPHSGHLMMVNDLSAEYQKVIIIIGKKERDFVTNTVSEEIWKLLPLNNNVEIVLSQDPQPIMTCYDFVFKSKEPVNYALVSCDLKEGENRSEQFVKNIEKYKETPTKSGFYAPKFVSGITVKYNKTLYYNNRSDEHNGEILSSSILRKDVINNDYDNFITNYPNINKDIADKIYLLLRKYYG